MHPDLEAIVEADAAAARDVASVQARLAGAEQQARDSAARSIAAGEAEARAALDAAIAAIDRDTQQHVEQRRSERAARRETLGRAAGAGVQEAIALYVRIVAGESGPGGAGP